MTERPGPQPHNAGITPNAFLPRTTDERLAAVEADVREIKTHLALLARIEALEIRLDGAESENRRLRSEMGENAR